MTGTSSPGRGGGRRGARTADPHATLTAVRAVEAWLRNPGATAKPARPLLADAVRLTARTLAQEAPGHSVELRVPPFVAVQCIEGPRHTRGTPPNVVEADPLTWLRLATGLVAFEEAESGVGLSVSGSRAHEIAGWLPVVPLERQ